MLFYSCDEQGFCNRIRFFPVIIFVHRNPPGSWTHSYTSFIMNYKFNQPHGAEVTHMLETAKAFGIRPGLHKLSFFLQT